ncbi:phosphoglucosamine mutase [Helicobacter saguini]|uniref:Phosphoglucosamine mutase n=1 Tax=Helicobacter saguini TaxID=1548018 RepID=A0A347W530_9HELI|nr:phosphoglucosamine mutase [Helicobacter saguini]MWV61614.1 phosphoglucosamine mutase [Helicobacter saguini]MWV67714.1 phosphoglucosamine mutase [Helicobacter saguini]MWV70066.1 phosphoglucosamine mutase [Helicobacter saguini]MWV72721.1 phosphoglucosamine mutase [Helicobacter saguini]TLD92015.1 phosphoglucosamine mutase [Helicobacter saguini]
MKIFGTDGVRGRAGVDITAKVALNLGIAAGIYFQNEWQNAKKDSKNEWQNGSQNSKDSSKNAQDSKNVARNLQDSKNSSQKNLKETRKDSKDSHKNTQKDSQNTLQNISQNIRKKDSYYNKILVGKDTRKSGYMVENALVSGLTSVGIDVIQIGPMPTPAIAFLTEDMRCDAGIMISASHNPYYDNGIKFFDSFGFKLDESKELKIEKIYHNLDSINCFKTDKNIGSSKRIDDVIGRYIVHIKNSFPKHLSLQGIRIVLDCANGAAYRVGPSIFRELGADVIVLNVEPNGYNINESCGAMYPNVLAAEVRRLRADVGFALDGDADRLVVVDNAGNIVDGDKLIGALALYQKSQNALKNNGIIATLMSNIALENFLKKHKIELKRCGVGDKFVLQEMQKHGFIFGGEQSGHIIFSQFAKTGDGLVSALQVLALMVTSAKSSEEILNPFELAPQKQSNIAVGEKIPLEKIDGLDKILAELDSKNIRHLIRYSGTENKLRILLEGSNPDTLEIYNDKLHDIFASNLKG